MSAAHPSAETTAPTVNAFRPYRNSTDRSPGPTITLIRPSRFSTGLPSAAAHPE